MHKFKFGSYYSLDMNYPLADFKNENKNLICGNL